MEFYPYIKGKDFPGGDYDCQQIRYRYQQVRHSLLGYLGVVVDIDPVYSLSEPSPDELAVNDELRAAPWYHVVMEDDNGLPVHTYRLKPS